MAKRPSILTGTAGVYYVAYELARRGYHAAVTHGNAPTVDLLVANVEGEASLSLQVKTSKWAMRTRGRGANKVQHHYEWDVGQKLARKNRANLYYAFVDLKSGRDEKPDVYIVPSKVVFDYFSPHQTLSRWRYHPRVDTIQQYKNNWDTLNKLLGDTT